MMAAMMHLIRRWTTGVKWRVICLWAALNAKSRTRRALEAVTPRRILVVCYGNICRSPYAASLLSARVPKSLQVRSAGFHLTEGRPCPAYWIESADAAGVRLSTHRSTAVTLDDLHWADLIVLMDRHNWHSLIRFGAELRKLVWLGAMNGPAEIADPYGREAAEVERIRRRLHACTEALAAALTKAS